MNRYQRQQMLEQIGAQGQVKLMNSSVLVVGCGGLGCPALQYLAGAGIGQITLVDPDVVEISNLHRQPLYGESNLGEFKAIAAKHVLNNLNPQIKIDTVTDYLSPANAQDLVRHADVVLDCADSFAATYILSDLCFEKNIPLISASALGLNGYVGGFCANSPSVRAVFPDLPATSASCNNAGILGPVVGLLGALQAQIAMSVLLNMKPSGLGRLISYDAQKMSFGGFDFSQASEPAAEQLKFIAPSAIQEKDFVIDLRSENETSELISTNAQRITINQFESLKLVVPENCRAILCCQSGLRAWRAAKLLKQNHRGEIALIAARLS